MTLEFDLDFILLDQFLMLLLMLLILF